jgi:hypothetical protein
MQPFLLGSVVEKANHRRMRGQSRIIPKSLLAAQTDAEKKSGLYIEP